MRTYSPVLRTRARSGRRRSGFRRPDLNSPFNTLQSAVHAAGAEEIIAPLPQGFDSTLDRWFADGTELVLGEWQRIAPAHAFLRRTPILMLDEPTSAMDPWAEAAWLARFRKLAAGRTVLIITHHFSTAMFADVIHVMSEGPIVESGTHQQLLQTGGRYAEGWAHLRFWVLDSGLGLTRHHECKVRAVQYFCCGTSMCLSQTV